MGKPTAPTPPDPQETAAASTGTNIGTAIANTNLGNVNQVGPNGSLTYSQSGSKAWTDPYTGKSYDIPQFTATTSLSPEMQKIYSGVTSRAGDVVGNLGNMPAIDAATYRNQAEDALMGRMAPQWERDRSRMETQMANQGIGVGSRAYSGASGDLERNINDARLGAILQGGTEAQRMMQMDAAARAQPINEINALLSTGQVATPQFQMNQPSQIATTDVAGLINANYGQQQQNYSNQMDAWNNTWGGLFGMGSAMLSDARAKENIRAVGATNGGLTVYTYNYKGSPKTHMGVMAQEALKSQPEAVREINGVLGVDYGWIK